MARTDTIRRTAKKPSRQRSELADTLIFLVKLVIFVALFRSFLFSPYSIPSQSMLPKLYIGDYLFVSKWNYGYSKYSLPFDMPLIPGKIFSHLPKRGDVVVFEGPKGDANTIIKRVIGLPGDSIQVRHGQVVLNGKAVPRQRVADFTLPLTPNYPTSECPGQFQDVDKAGTPICRYPQFRETLPDGKSYMVLDRGDNQDGDNTGVYNVPAGTVFLMGDNRDDSADSRFPAPADALPGQSTGMGFIPVDHLEGKALVSFWSTDGSSSWIKPWTWFTAARWNRIGHGY